MLLIDKPIGISSFSVISAVRTVTGIKKVGHAGTLDPLASGLMLITNDGRIVNKVLNPKTQPV